MGYDEDREFRQNKVAPTEEDYVASLVYQTIEGQKLLVVSFFLDSDEYAFEVSDAVEVLRPSPFTHVPRTPEFLKGVVSVRGDMVPVIDLKNRLGLGAFENTPTGRVLVTAADDVRAGFLVDRLAGVEEIPKKLVKPPGRARTRFPKLFLKGTINIRNRKIRLLNILTLLDFSVG